MPTFTVLLMKPVTWYSLVSSSLLISLIGITKPRKVRLSLSNRPAGDVTERFAQWNLIQGTVIRASLGEIAAITATAGGVATGTASETRPVALEPLTLPRGCHAAAARRSNLQTMSTPLRPSVAGSFATAG
jgi:hypothetical protein